MKKLTEFITFCPAPFCPLMCIRKYHEFKKYKNTIWINGDRMKLLPNCKNRRGEKVVTNTKLFDGIWTINIHTLFYSTCYTILLRFYWHKHFFNLELFHTTHIVKNIYSFLLDFNIFVFNLSLTEYSKVSDIKAPHYVFKTYQIG